MCVAAVGMRLVAMPPPGLITDPNEPPDESKGGLADPAALVAELSRSPKGVEWLMDRWKELYRVLKDRGTGSPRSRSRPSA